MWVARSIAQISFEIVIRGSDNPKMRLNAIAAALLIGGLLAASIRLHSAFKLEALSMHSDGTLVIMAASQDGLVVASDSRQTIDNATFCDGAEKLLEPARRDRFLLAVTGRRGFYPSLQFALGQDVCGYIKHTSREFDLGEVAKKYVEADAAVDLASFDLLALSNNCVRELRDYLLANPHRQPIFSGDKFSSTVVLASYDPATRTAIIRSFEIAVSPDGTALNTKLGLNETFGPDDFAEPIAIGEQVYLTKQVLPALKDHPISATTRQQLGDFPNVNFPRVKDQSLQQAIEVAADLIEAASRMTETVPAASGIGGPLDIRLLGDEPRPVRQTR